MLLTLTIASLIFALAMGVVAWRASSDARRRSEARIEALALEIHQPSPAADLGLGVSEAERSLFAASRPAPKESRRGLAFAAGALLVCAVAAAAIAAGGRSPAATAGDGGADDASAATAPAAKAALPLELVALVHEHEGNRLTVRGTIRNPASGTEMEHVTAVVFLFTREGGFLASGRSAIAAPVLAPGRESTFAVTVPLSGEVGRYRVSFRSGEQVISHVDLRSAS